MEVFNIKTLNKARCLCTRFLPVRLALRSSGEIAVLDLACLPTYM